MPTNDKETAEVAAGNTGHNPTPIKPPPSPPPAQRFLQFVTDIVIIAAAAFLVNILFNRLFNLNQAGYSNLQPAAALGNRSQQE